MKTAQIYDLIIVGGGPAGITAGIYSLRQNLNVLMITKDFGGQIGRKTVAIENWPGRESISGPELIESFTKHLQKYPIKIKKEEVLKIQKLSRHFVVATENKKKFKAKAIIIATGADPRPLEAIGEKKFINKGVSYCVLCDGAWFRNKIVAVVGGGDSGFEAALFLSNYAKKIYILEFLPEVRAFKGLQKRVLGTKKVKIITNAEIKEIQGTKFVEKLIYQKRDTKQDKVLRVDGVFIEIGNQPATSFVKKLVDFSKKDEIIINPKTCETKTPGLFAAGDVTDVSPKQIVVAAGEGAKAAVNAYKYLQKLNGSKN